MSEEQHELKCDEEPDWDQPVTWRNVRWPLVAMLTWFVVSTLFDKYLRPLPWWQQTVGLLTIFFLAGVVWASLEWRTQRAANLALPWRSVASSAIFVTVIGSLFWLLISGVHWLIDRYVFVQNIFGVIGAMAFVAFVTWGIVESARLRRERRGA